jgi:chemotaxis protein histidine kinase CheA
MVHSDPIVVDFVAQSQQRLTEIFGQLRAIRTVGLAENQLRAIISMLYMIQGTAGLLGLHRIQALSHGLSEHLTAVQRGERPMSTEGIRCVLRAVRFLGDLLASVESSNDADVEPYLACLRHHAAQPVSRQDAPVTPHSAHINPLCPPEFGSILVGLNTPIE